MFPRIKGASQISRAMSGGVKYDVNIRCSRGHASHSWRAQLLLHANAYCGSRRRCSFVRRTQGLKIKKKNDAVKTRNTTVQDSEESRQLQRFVLVFVLCKCGAASTHCHTKGTEQDRAIGPAHDSYSLVLKAVYSHLFFIRFLASTLCIARATLILCGQNITIVLLGYLLPMHDVRFSLHFRREILETSAESNYHLSSCITRMNTIY